MEGWENRILRDKLNGLQNLPADYAPDLSSKWEIVEAGLPVSKKRRLVPFIVRWSVAAAVLLAISIVWLNEGKKETPDLVLQKKTVHIVSPVQKQPSLKTSQDTVNPGRLLVLQPSHQTTTSATPKIKPATVLAYQAPSETTIIPVGEDTNRGSIAILPVNSPSILAPQQTSVATVLVEKPRPTKKKIYQRDFSDGVLVMDTGFAPANRQHFSIQLKPFSRKTTDDGEETIHRLQLKQAL